MRPLNLALIVAAVLALPTIPTPAQQTVVYIPQEPRTRLEDVEARVATILIKANAPVGTVTTSRGTVSVTCKESKDVGRGSVQRGIAVAITPTDKAEDVTLLDHDEVGGLLKAVDYLSKVDWAVTSLPNFSAAYETRGGFRVAVFVSKRTGTIELAVRTTHEGNTPIRMSREQFAQFKLFVEQAKKLLDDLSPLPSGDQPTPAAAQENSPPQNVP